MPGNPTGHARPLQRRTSTVDQFTQTFARKDSSQSVDDNIQALLTLSATLAKEIPEDSNKPSYLIGVKVTVNGRECITLCSDRFLNEDPHAERWAGLKSEEVSWQDKKKILSDILESRQDRKDSAANLRLQKLIDHIEENSSLATENFPDRVGEALLAVRLEDIEARYKPEAGGNVHGLIQEVRKTFQDAPDTFHDKDIVAEVLSDIAECVVDSGAKLAKEGLKQLLVSVLESPALQKEGPAYEAIRNVIAHDEDLSAHLEIQTFQNLVNQIQQHLPKQGKAVSSSFDASLLVKRQIPVTSPSARNSLLSMGLSREASLADVPEERGLPLPLRQCAKELVKLYYGKVDELISRHASAESTGESSGLVMTRDKREAAGNRAAMKEAIEILTQYRSHELTKQFKDNPAGLVKHQMGLPEEAGEYKAAELALIEIARLNESVYRSEYKDRPESLRAEMEKLKSSVSGSVGNEEAVNKAVVAWKLEVMDKVLTSLNKQLGEQRSERIRQRSESLFQEFVGPISLGEHKAKLLENDPAFQDTEEYEAIEKAIKMLKAAQSIG